jgi:uncharacterized protein
MGSADVDETGSLCALNRTRGTILCASLEEAGGVLGKSRGLLGRDGLGPNSGMLFQAGRFEPFMWMHMMLMRFAIDIVFLDRNGKVARIDHNLKPWRISSIVWGARRALELTAGAAERSQTMEGDLIVLERR